MVSRIPPFDDLIKFHEVDIVSKDSGTARSMIEKAEKRLRFVNSIAIDYDNATFLFEEIYTVILECAQCLMMADGYRAKGPSHHQAAVAFIAGKYREFGDKLASDFDRYRKMRADSVYRDDYISAEVAKEALAIAEEYVRITRLIFDSKYPGH